MSQFSVSNRVLQVNLSWAFLLGVLLTSGCEPKPARDVSAPRTEDPIADSARRILGAVAEAYSSAKSYEDVGELYVEAESQGQKQTSGPNEYTTTFERPNRFRVHAFGVIAMSDGELLRAVVPGIEQILTLPVSSKVEMDDLLSDRILAEGLSSGLSVTLPPLRLLTGDKQLPGFGPKARLIQLSDAKIDDKTYHRVEAAGEEGKTVYWVDPKTNLLGRVEFPIEAILKQQPGQADSLKIWADFKGARFDDVIAAKAFEFEAPPNAPLVKRLLPPPPPPPSPLVGQEVGQFAFDHLQSEGMIDGAAVLGKVAVFDFWATWCGYCFQGFPNLQKVFDKFADNDKVAVYAVDTDEASVNDDDVKKSFSAAKLRLPIVRDREEFNKQAFDVRGLPTLVVIDGKGIIQHVHVGYDPELEPKLTKVIDELLDGKDLAKETLEAHEAQRSKYEADLNEALIGTTSTVEVPQSKIADRSEPSKLKLEPLWTAEDVGAPGNLLVFEEPREEPTIYLLSESKKIARLNSSGKVVDKIDLKLPEEVGVSSLRTATNASGERFFVAFASTQQQLFLFDKSWKPLLAYPESRHSGLSDVQLADLDGDGQPEILVGYWGVVGVQSVSLSGERKWSNRQLENVTRLAISDPADDGTRFALCANNRDFITPLDHAGKAQKEIAVAGQTLFALYAADLDGAPPVELCALSSSEVGVVTAIGLNAMGDSLWNNPLPHGLHNQPVELVTPGRLPTTDDSTQGVWLLAGPDSSIQVLAADGSLIDRFNYGEELTGIATATLDGAPALIVSSKNRIQAWKVKLQE